MIYRANRYRPIIRGRGRCGLLRHMPLADPARRGVRVPTAAVQQANETTFETGSVSVENSEMHAIVVRSGSVASGIPQADHWRSALGHLDE
jgi:hypothetical protein